MALLRYLQCTDNLPDSRGSLLSAVPRPEITCANQVAQAAVDSEVEVRERGKQPLQSGIVLPLEGTLHNMEWLQ